MTWRLKGSIFGLNLDLDIETNPPTQEIYAFRLKRKWGKREFLDNNQSREFIAYALRYLPDQSFIIFDFDLSNRYFVQLCKTEGLILLDIPFRIGNPFYGKDKEIIELLRSIKHTRRYRKQKSPMLKPNTFFNHRRDKEKKEVEVDFGKNYDKATEATLLIAKRIFEINNPNIFSYESDRLVPAN